LLGEREAVNRAGLGAVGLDDAPKQQLVGREAELATVDRLVAGFVNRRQRCLEISGEPGIGKSALLHRLGEESRRWRYQVLVGAGADLERDVPFALLVDAVDDRVSELDDRHVRRICGPELAEVASVLPALGHLAVEAPARLQEERYRLHRAVRRLLAGLAGDAPLVLILDDVHWADRESIEFLSHLLRHPVPAPLLVAIAVRAGQGPRLLASALAAAERDGGVERLRLGPLSRHAVAQLTGRGLDERTRERLYRDSGGNPFYAAALARAYRPSPRSRRAAATTTLDGDVPASVVEAIAAELDGLAQAARPVL